jgi:hypothetical protein
MAAPAPARRPRHRPAVSTLKRCEPFLESLTDTSTSLMKRRSTPSAQPRRCIPLDQAAPPPRPRTSGSRGSTCRQLLQLRLHLLRLRGRLGQVSGLGPSYLTWRPILRREVHPVALPPATWSARCPAARPTRRASHRTIQRQPPVHARQPPQ